jgi:TolB-like protein/AraC-like DNA-binding protein/Tfp pilus assembly protein PilF
LANTTSIAVLPFKNISSDPDNEFFCDGISEEIINALARIEQLRVTSRTSSFIFKDHQSSIKEIGEKLDVGILLEGSVRVGGSKLRITAQLIDVEQDAHFWSQSWDRDMGNLFEVQDEISLLIADRLREHLGHMEISDHLVDKHTEDVEAYQHYLKGRYHFLKWNPGDVKLAIEEFHKAIAADANLIDGHVGLADAYSFMAVAGFAPREEAWAKAITSLNTAKSIDENNAQLNYMLGNQAFFTEANYASAVEYGLKALARLPTYAEAHRFMTFLYGLKGDFKKAKEHIFYAKSIDPLNPETRFFEGFYYYRLGDFSRADEIFEGLLEENDKNLPALVSSFYVKIRLGRVEEARALVESTPEELFTPDERIGLLAVIEVTEKDTNHPNLDRLIVNAEDPIAHHAHSYLFVAYSIAGEHDKAFEVLQNLFDHHSSILLLSFSDPMVDELKSHPDYQGFHQRIYRLEEAGEEKKKPRSRKPDKALIEDQSTRLMEYVDTEKPYLNPALTLRLLAGHIDIHPNQLSWLLNEHLGENFNEFINKRRVEHFKKLVVDPANAHISLIGLAYQSGFNSKTVFNTAFKKEVGMTPKAYQKSHM